MPYKPLLTFVAAVLVVGCNITLVKATPEEKDPKLAGVPPDYFPAAGDCRVWIPGESTREQTAPGPCYELVWYVPPGGWLVRTPHSSLEPVEVWEFGRRRAYGDERPPVESVLYLDRDTGRIASEQRVTYENYSYYNQSPDVSAAAGAEN
jgi:hypothetical protein